MADDESWECVWPPEVTEDTELVNRVIKVIEDPLILKFHARAWEALSQPGNGIHPTLSLVDELREKSGLMVKPFIDLAIANVFPNDQIGTLALGSLIETILQSTSVEDEAFNEDLDEDGALEARLHDKRCLDLYRGCAWELSAMFCVHLIGLSREAGESERLPASCNEPLDRAIFIRHHC